MKLLLTGFGPFPGVDVNPTMPVVDNLDGQTIGDYDIVGRILPVVFSEVKAALHQAIDDVQPDMIVSLGVAAGRYHITPERIAVNIASSSKPDNNGHIATEEPIDAEGPHSYVTRLPITHIVEALKAANYPASISNTAGTYVCNTVMYEGLRYAERQHIPAGFIHIPANFELSIAHGRVPGWHQRDLNDAIFLAIETIVKMA
jgi:pyroglutamyl-peptidase